MGKGSNPLAPLNKIVGKLDPTANYLNKAVEDYTGIDPTRKDEGLQNKVPVAPQLSNGTSSRQVVSGSSGVIKKVYDKKDKKR